MLREAGKILKETGGVEVEMCLCSGNFFHDRRRNIIRDAYILCSRVN